MFHYSLSNRIFIAIILLILLPLAGTAIYAYTQVYTAAEKEARQYSLDLAGKLIVQTEELLKQKNVSMDALLFSPELQRLANNGGSDWVNDYKTIYRLSDRMISLFAWQREIMGVFAIFDQGGIVHELTRSAVHSQYPFKLEDFYTKTQWNEKPVIDGPHAQLYVSGEQVFSITRPIIENRTFVWRGALRVDVDADQIFSLYRNTRIGHDGYIIVIDEKNRIVYHPNSDLIGSYMRAYEASIANEDPYSAETPTDLVTISSFNLTPWKIISYIPKNGLYASTSKVKATMLITAVLSIALCLLATRTLTSFLVRPLRYLNRAIHQLGKNVSFSRLNVKVPEELQPLMAQYNATAGELEQRTSDLVRAQLVQHEALMRTREMEYREREAEFLQLQAQINPHFLNNTLSCIDSMAELEGAEQIQEAVGYLSTMLYYATAFGATMATIRDELFHAQAFVKIQTFRHGDRIRVVWDVDHELLDAPMIRLTLQPLIENAYFHGVEPMLEGGTIKISIQAEDGFLNLTVSDNGVGFDSDKLTAIVRYIADQGEAGVQTGIRNVFRRLFLAYGSSCDIEIRSEANLGTYILIRLPL